MNKIIKWHYDKARNGLLKEMEEKGIMIRDEKIFDKYVRKIARKNVIYNFLFIVMIILVILRWIGVY